MTRACSVCALEKDLSCFHVNKKSRGGRDTRCAECKNAAKRDRDAKPEIREKNREYRLGEVYKSYVEKRAAQRQQAAAKRAEENRVAAGEAYMPYKDAVSLGLTQYNEGLKCKAGHISNRYVKNRQCIECAKEKAKTIAYKDQRRQFYAENKERLMRANVDNQRRRYSEDDGFKAAVACRNMLKRALSSIGAKKSSKTTSILGYTPECLRFRMESQFSNGMTWENYGEWHIDHIKPVSAFIREGETNPAVINALSNLQPLWAEDNFAKRDKYES